MIFLASLLSIPKRSAPTPTCRATSSMAASCGFFSSTTARARRVASSTASSMDRVIPFRPLIAWPSRVTTS